MYKSFFLGPGAENADWVRELADQIIADWIKWRRATYPEDCVLITKKDKSDPQFKENIENIKKYLLELNERFGKEVPTFTPRYIGHMVSEISVPALLGHIITLLHNPNNIVQDVSLIGTQIEQEAIVALAEMIGYEPSQMRGHFTSGGTVANIEGLIRARSRVVYGVSVIAGHALES